jgi:transposase InsO family protein
MGHHESLNKGCPFYPSKDNLFWSDRGSQFTSNFWEKFHESMDTKLNFSSAYHPQIDGQTERTNQILEDMLRACALEYGKS